jgi:HD-GYP domain-containing protein (c-di-GMP phosphodiesterase class II)
MAVADVYDALVSIRPYKKPFSHEEACKIIIDGSGTHFDPDVVDAFLSIQQQFQDVSKEFSEPKHNKIEGEV